MKELPTSLSPAYVSGVIDVLYSARARSWGLSDGKLYHQFQPGSEEELSYSQGCEDTGLRLMMAGNLAAEREPAKQN